MLGEMTSAAGGGGLGGLLGQVGGVLSTPRRALWSALGLPESGTELLAQNFGLDPDSLVTQGLGMGAEMAGDPLSYAGSLVGLAGKLGLGARAAGGAGELADAGAAALPKSTWPAGPFKMTPMGGFGDYAPAAAGGMDYAAIQRGLEADAAASAEREAAALARPAAEGPLVDPAELARRKQLRPMNDVDKAHRSLDNLPAHHQIYDDLMEDLSRGAVTPQDALAPRMDLLRELVGGEMLNTAQRTPEEIARLQQLHDHAEALNELAGGQANVFGRGDADVLRGLPLNPTEAGNFRDQARELAEAFGRLPSYGDTAQPPLPLANDALGLLRGTVPSTEVGPLLGRLQGAGLPIDVAAARSHYLGEIEHRLRFNLPYAMRGHPTELQPDGAVSLLREIVGDPAAVQDALYKAQQAAQAGMPKTILDSVTGWFRPSELQSWRQPQNTAPWMKTEEGQRRINPIIEALLARVQENMGPI